MKPSKRQFAMQVAKAISGLNGKRYSFDARKFALLGADSKELINLKNLYLEHCACPNAVRPDDIKKIASIFGQPQILPKSFEDAKAYLRPKILCRSKLEFDDLKRRIEGCGVLDTPHESIGSHLCSIIVYSTDHSMIFVTGTLLEEWGVTFKQAMEVACKNVDASTIAWSVMGGHLHSSTSGDNYDSSRIMLVDRIRSLEVAGSHLAVVPNRETLFVAGTEDHGSIKIMFELTKNLTEDEARLICPLPLQLKNGKWLDWEPPKNHFVRLLYEELNRNFLGRLYHKQRELLVQLAHEPRIALFAVLEVERGSFSFCCWREGVDLLLPKTDWIVFYDAEGEIVASNVWEHVMAIVDDSVLADDAFYPTLYRVRQFPTDEQLRRIGNIDFK